MYVHNESRFAPSGIYCSDWQTVLLCVTQLIRRELFSTFFCTLSCAGFRIGKGEGYADMEYGMMASMGAVNDSTVVVTVVHDCQVCLLTLSSSYQQIKCLGAWSSFSHLVEYALNERQSIKMSKCEALLDRFPSFQLMHKCQEHMTSVLNSLKKIIIIT